MKKILIGLLVLAGVVAATKFLDVPLVQQKPIAPIVYTDNDTKLFHVSGYHSLCGVPITFAEGTVLTARQLNEMQIKLVECINSRLSVPVE